MEKVDDPYNLQRFVQAQDPIYAQVCTELRRGQKQSHWIWFIFPQLRGLGHSQMSNTFGIGSREEAETYLKHPILGPRLIECTSLVYRIEGRSGKEIFGFTDNLKFRSSMSLFASIALDQNIFTDALRKYFDGELDPLTVQRF